MEAPDRTAEDEGVAGDQDVDVALFDLADLAAATAAGQQADIEHRRAHDGADVQPVAQGGHGVAHTPAAVGALHDAAEAVVGLQGVAPGGDEIEHLVEVLPRQVGVGRRRQGLGIEVAGQEGVAAADAHDVLGEYVERAGALRIAVEGAFGHRLPGGLAFQHLEAAGGHQQGPGRFVQPVVGPSDPLHQPRGALGSRQLDD